MNKESKEKVVNYFFETDDSVRIAEDHSQDNKNENAYYTLFEHAPCGLLTLTPEGEISSINSIGIELIGGKQKLITQPVFVDHIDPDYHRTMFQAMQKTAMTGISEPAELKLKTTRGQDQRWLRADVRAHIASSGKLRQWQVSLCDITESQQTHRRTERELKNRNLLMRELNHRVANNLMMISTLIMQKEMDEGRNSDLDEIRYQIEAIRYVHEFLQKSEEYREIDMRGYLKELLSTIFSYFTAKEIEVRNETDKISLDTQSAIYIGIIINEAATNAIKYGFNSEEKPSFSVRFVESEDRRHYILTISNSGNPFPEELDISKSESLGLSLIASLTEELNGEVELSRSPSPVFTVRFPKEDG